MRKIIAIVFAFTIPMALLANSVESMFKSGNNAYEHKKYADAINIYEQIIDSGYTSAELYYNLGNAYYKTNNIAYAILNYERADKLSDDADIDHNLAVARLKTIDKIEPVKQIFIMDWLDSIRDWQNSNSWSSWAIIFVWAVFLFLSLLIYSKNTTFKKASFLGVVTFLILFALTFYFSYSSNQNEYVKKFAILTSPSSYVKSSPDTQSQDLFILHEGAKMQVLDRVGDWNKIKLANGEVGWIDKSSFRPI
ncbi:tetratricopeptide repeat protein [bacterium]|nr:MAG: tetratricopeptide repeat protein [bacterium]